MTTEADMPSIIHSTRISCILRELGVPTHLNGFRQLCFAIPYYAQTNAECLSKEIYPAVAEQFGHASGISIERAIRSAILYAWINREADAWDKYFPGALKVPSNKVFITVLAEYVR